MWLVRAITYVIIELRLLNKQFAILQKVILQTYLILFPFKTLVYYRTDGEISQYKSLFVAFESNVNI